MSGRRIDDMGGMPHTSEMAMKSKTHLKEYRSVEGAGHLGSMYPDTDPQIKEGQEKGVSQVHKHPMKSGSRY